MTMLLTAALQDYRAIWRVTTTQRDPRSMRAMRWTVRVAAVLAALFIGTLVVRHHVAPARLPALLLRTSAGIAVFWLAIVWTMLYVPTSVMLNATANARLLPRQRRRLLQMAVGGWLLATAGVAAVLGTGVALPVAGLYLLGFALGRAGNTVALVLIILASNAAVFFRHLLPPALVDVAMSPGGLVASTLVLLALASWALDWLYPAGGDSLGRRAVKIRHMETIIGTNRWASQPEAGGLAARWGSLPVYAAALRRDCRRPTPGRMLMHALGPGGHWSAWIPGMAVLLAMGTLLRVATIVIGGPVLDAVVQGIRGTGLGAMVAMVLFSTAQYTQQLHRNRGEQALLRLTPLAGAAELLNRRLALQLLRAAFVNWAMLTVLILVLSLLLGGDAMLLLRQLGLCCLAGQVASMGVLDDYAADGGWNLRLALRGAGVAVLQAGAAAALGWLGGAATWTWVGLIVIAGGTAAILLLRGWRRMLAAAPAFPAGRLA